MCTQEKQDASPLSLIIEALDKNSKRVIGFRKSGTKDAIRFSRIKDQLKPYIGVADDTDVILISLIRNNYTKCRFILSLDDAGQDITHILVLEESRPSIKNPINLDNDKKLALSEVLTTISNEVEPTIKPVEQEYFDPVFLALMDIVDVRYIG